MILLYGVDHHQLKQPTAFSGQHLPVKTSSFSFRDLKKKKLVIFTSCNAVQNLQPRSWYTMQKYAHAQVT
jgi:hypothetical protein